MPSSIDDLLSGSRSDRLELAERLWKLKAKDRDKFRELLARHQKKRRQVYLELTRFGGHL